MTKSIHTSEKGWLKELAECYRADESVLLIDDAEVGVDPDEESLLGMGMTARLSAREISGVCVACGVSVAGAGMIVAAWFDPEPTSKLGLLIVGGTTALILGGGSAFWVLTKKKPPTVKVHKGGFEISWDSV